MTLLIHESNKSEDLFLKVGTDPDPKSTKNDEFNNGLTIIKIFLEGGKMDNWKEIATRCMGVSEEITMGVHRMYTLYNTGTDHQN